MPTFAILTALWKREAIAKLVLAHTAGLAARLTKETGCQVVLAAVGSEPSGASGESNEECCAKELGWEYWFAPNSPLGVKWNHGMCRLRGRADGVMCIGSDDLISYNILLAAYESVVHDGFMFWGCRDLYYVTYGPKAMYWPGYEEGHPRHGEPIGCGRTMHKDLLDILGWTPWVATAERGLDFCLWMKLRQDAELMKQTDIVSLNGGMMIDIKLGSVSLSGNAYETAQTVPVTDLSEDMPEEVITPLLEMAKRPTFDHCEKPFISACLMVCNEGESIRGCLESLHGCVDEVTVLDTGSTDETITIAREYGVRVVECQADQPFDMAMYRNQSLQYGRGEWIIVIDGKDRLVNGHLLREYLSKVPDECNTVAMHLQTFGGPDRTKPSQGQNYIHRCLRGKDVRRGTLCYEYPRHHQLTGVGQFTTMPQVFIEKAWADVSASARRNIPVLEKMLARSSSGLIKANGRDMAALTKQRQHALLYLSRSYMVIGGSLEEGCKESIEAYEQAAIYSGKLIDEQAASPVAWLTLLSAVERTRGLQFCTELVVRATVQFPELRELHWWQMRVSAAWIAVLTSRPEVFPMVPQRCPAEKLPQCADFLGMRFFKAAEDKEESKPG